MYRAVERFADLTDKMHLYEVGDKFPHSGSASAERIKELMSVNNKAGKVLIEEVPEERKKKRNA